MRRQQAKHREDRKTDKERHCPKWIHTRREREKERKREREKERRKKERKREREKESGKKEKERKEEEKRDRGMMWLLTQPPQYPPQKHLH